MPRRRVSHRKVVQVFHEDFPAALERFRQASGLPWSEMARLIGTDSLTVWRWRRGAHPSWDHLLALLALAEDLDLANTLPVRRAAGPPS